MSNIKKFSVSLASVFLFVACSNPVQASQWDDCDFGFTAIGSENGNEICSPTQWVVDYSNDSFDSMLFSYLMADTTDSPDASDISVELNCRNSKSLNVYVFGDEDLYALTNSRGIGTALMTFDNGAVQKFTYKRTYDSSQIYFLQPKLVAKKIIKSKRQFNLKFLTYSGPSVAYFPAADTSETTLRFKRAGCPLG